LVTGKFVPHHAAKKCGSVETQKCVVIKKLLSLSGGLDSTILASLANEFVPHDDLIDLLNVAFEREKK